MVKHIILWNLKEELSAEEKSAIKANAKKNLESLKGKIDGLTEIKVNIHPLPSSNCDMMLDSSFESASALKAYSSHPEHVAVADTYVRPYTSKRACFDFED